MDSINRQAAIDVVHREIFAFFDICSDDDESPITYKDEQLLELNKAITTSLRKLPSAEPEDIKCKDCKYLFDGVYRANCCEILMKKANWVREITVDDNWHCADGKRRDNG